MNQKKWMGNIRELENFVERIVAISAKDEKIIKADKIRKEMKDELKRIYEYPSEAGADHSLNELLSSIEENLLRQASVNCRWNQTKAARSLKIP